MKPWQVHRLHRLRNLMVITVMSIGFAVYYTARHYNEDQLKQLEIRNRSIMSEGLELVRTVLNLQQPHSRKLASKFT